MKGWWEQWIGRLDKVAEFLDKESSSRWADWMRSIQRIGFLKMSKVLSFLKMTLKLGGWGQVEEKIVRGKGVRAERPWCWVNYLHGCWSHTVVTRVGVQRRRGIQVIERMNVCITHEDTPWSLIGLDGVLKSLADMLGKLLYLATHLNTSLRVVSFWRWSVADFTSLQFWLYPPMLRLSLWALQLPYMTKLK